ncbi:hypothetical protein QCD60_12275 [Pokkaliibacter sp. MBI-7]|uniref:hypothetical protein n=1 Tax=Pokkaliibacter sp. MBI-7 TaxID=3040600 RepID=UPI00244B4F32|nr:hypothetical protein [Pokkaliibacter sp. MBI-7]MDH2433347.1 hypothetical protein [Pokkaliibacter sp. MBI-7]
MTSSLTGPGLARQLSLPAESSSVHPRPVASQDDLTVGVRRSQLNTRVHHLQRALQQELQRHRRYDHSVRQDWGPAGSYAEQRRADLRQLRGAEHIAAQYGLSAARKDPPLRDILHHLRIDHDVSSDYLRDQPSMDYRELGQQLYRQQCGARAMPALIVNSRHVASQLLEHFRGTKDIQGSPEQHLRERLQTLAPGVLALQFKARGSVSACESLLNLYGGRPSAHALLAAVTGTHSRSVEDPHIHNVTLLNQFYSDDPDVCTRLRSLPADHALAPLSNTAAALLEQWLDVADDRQLAALQPHNPVLANGLEALHRIADTLPSLSHDSQLFGNGYQVLLEELQVCLSATRPFTQDDFRLAAAPMLSVSQLAQTVPKQDIYLVSSGMAALTLGFEVADMLTGERNVAVASTARHGQTPVYFEVETLRREWLIGQDHSHALFATLNHSMPGAAGSEHWGVDAVIEATAQRLQQARTTDPALVLLLDATLEQRNDMAQLVQHFATPLQTGQLRMVVCKSYQKFAGLGSAKVMAGAIGLIGREDAAHVQARNHLQRVEQELDWMGHNDGQLLVHLLGCREQEFALLERACDSTAYVARHLLQPASGREQEYRYAPQLPFVAVDIQASSPPLTLNLAEGSRTLNLLRDSQFSEHLLPVRDSFAFIHSSRTQIPTGDGGAMQRLALGQESKAELTERLFMPGLLLQQPQGAGWDCGKACRLVQLLASDGMRSVQVPAHIQPTLYQKLYISGRLEQAPVSDLQRLQQAPEPLRQHQQGERERPMTLNKIVSVVSHLGEQIMRYTRPENWRYGADRQLLDAMLDGLMHSGMPGISHSGRQLVMELQAFLCRADMHSDDTPQQQRGLRVLTDSCARLPGLPRQPDYLLAIPEQVFSAAGATQQDRTLAALFEPLDGSRRLSLISQMLEQGDLAKADACISRFEHLLDRQLPAAAEALRPQQAAEHSEQHLYAQLQSQWLRLTLGQLILTGLTAEQES